jgi:hypothetical protein
MLRKGHKKEEVSIFENRHITISQNSSQYSSLCHSFMLPSDCMKQDSYPEADICSVGHKVLYPVLNTTVYAF